MPVSTNHHTPLAVAGQSMNATDVTTPDAELDAAIGDFATLTTTADTSVVAAINELHALVLTVGGATVTDAVLKEWTTGEDYELTSITRDSDGVITTATVKWPDGSAGTFTTTTKNSTWVAIDAFSITHVASSKTVVQAAVTRNASGAVVTKPALTIS